MPASGTEAAIYEAIVSFASQISVVPAMPIALPGVVFLTPNANAPYLVASIVPNTATLNGMAFDTTIDNRGLLQISVNWKAGVGMIAPMNVASQIVKIFKPGTRITLNGVTVFFEDQPRIVNPMQVSDMVTIPVIMQWRCLTPANV